MSIRLLQQYAHTWSIPVNDPRFAKLTPEKLFSLQASVNRMAWLDCSGQGVGWSYFACNPSRQEEIRHRSPLAQELIAYSFTPYLRQFNHLHQCPPFCGGWIGFLAYDAASSGQSLSRFSRVSFFDG